MLKQGIWHGGEFLGGAAGASVGSFVGSAFGQGAGAVAGSVVPGVGTAVGAAVGGAAGGLLGATVGGAAGEHYGGKYSRQFTKYVGLGDYGSVGTNQIMGGGGQISVNATGDMTGDIVLNHREFVGNVIVVGTGGQTSKFASVSYPINAGLQSTFPWLSQIAQNFTMYQLEGCIFQYVPNSGEFGGSTNALGKVVLATNYDPDAAPFSSTVQAENYDYANAGKPSVELRHGIETASRQLATNMLYVRTGETSKDLVFTDYGNLQVITEGIQIGGTGAQVAIIGELWVTYKVRLSRANLYGALLGKNIGNDSFVAVSNTTSWVALSNSLVPTSVFAGSYAQLFGSTKACPKLTNNIGGTLTSPDSLSMVYTFPQGIVRGTYMLTWNAVNSTNASGAPFSGLPGPFTNCSLVISPNIGTDDETIPLVGVWNAPGTSATASFNHTFQIVVTVDAPGPLIASVEWNMFAVPQNGTFTYLTVNEVCETCFLA